MGIIGTLIIGFIVGVVARFVHPGDDKMGFLVTIVLGVLGSVVATYGGQVLGWYRPGESAGFIGATIGAVVLLVVVGIVRRSSRD